jgi:hypothetical protein
VESLVLGEQVQGAYVDPPLSSDAEIDSFNFQQKDVNRTTEPEHVQEALCRMESLYSTAKWEIPQNFGTEEHIREVVMYVMAKCPKKSPGAIFLRQGLNTNADVLLHCGIEGIVAQVSDRIKDLVDGTLEDARYKADPIRLFVKREAHKASKVKDKRWRLIWGISLIDQVIDRMLYTPGNEAEIKSCADIPSKPGYSFKYGGYDRMVRKYDNHSKKWISFDARSFDISAPGWGLRAVRDFNQRQCLTGGVLLEKWEKLSRHREEAVLYGSFVFSNGIVCQKTIAGLQPSGRFTTISSNCKLVVLTRVLYDIHHERPTIKDAMIAMGDDTVQDQLDDPQQFVDWIESRCGIHFTIESKQGTFPEQNFCSTETRKLPNGVYVPVPLNWAKNSYELCHPESKIALNEETLKENRGSALQSLCGEYVFHERFDELHSLLAKYCPEKFFSREKFQQIVTGWESASSDDGRKQCELQWKCENIHGWSSLAQRADVTVFPVICSNDQIQSEEDG